MPTQTLKSNPIIAYVAPFAIYIGITMVESSDWLGLSYEAVCTLKGIITAIALWIFRKHYPPFATKGFAIAIAMGALGLVVWLAFDRLQNIIPGLNNLMNWIFQGGRVGYDPYAKGELKSETIAFIAVRLVELAIIFPLAEELFWRGFLARYIIANDFQNVPHGKFTATSFAIVTLAFASVHPEILAAIAWGMLINFLYRKTANLWACIAMHAVTNAFLGAYVLITGNWQLW